MLNSLGYRKITSPLGCTKAKKQKKKQKETKAGYTSYPLGGAFKGQDKPHTHTHTHTQAEGYSSPPTSFPSPKS